MESSRMFTNPKTKERFSKDQRPIFTLPTDQEVTFETQLKKGREILICIYRWYDLLLRGKNGYKMDDKPFDLICIRPIDKATGAALFKRDMFVGVWGKDRRSHATIDIQQDYQH
ncbi:MAG: hypothetical protein AB8G86_30690, partial [Saprospiraceae bacterium]